MGERGAPKSGKGEEAVFVHQGYAVYRRECHLPVRVLEAEWSQSFPELRARLTEDLEVSALVNAIKISGARAKIASKYRMEGFRENWNTLRAEALIKAILMKISGNPDIQIIHTFTNNHDPKLVEKLGFGFRVGEYTTDTLEPVQTLADVIGVRREEILKKIGRFDESVTFPRVNAPEPNLGVRDGFSERLGSKVELVI